MKTKTLFYITLIVCLLFFASTALAQDTQPKPRSATPLEIIMTGVIALLVIGAIAYTVVRQYQNAQTIRDTDWVEYFTEAMSDSRTGADAGESAEKEVSSPGEDSEKV